MSLLRPTGAFRLEGQPVAELDRRTWLRRNWAVDGWLQTLAACLIVGLVLAASGAFETGRLPLFTRFAYWIGLVAVGVLLARVIRELVVRSAWLCGKPWLAASAIALMTSLLMTGVVGVSNALILGAPFIWGRIYAVFPDVIVVTASLTVLSILIRGGPSSQTHQAPEGAPPPRFLSRLPAKLSGAVLFAVEAEDHYLRLHTSKGRDLILMRLSDALPELEGIEGARTHRSWWVARSAVVSAERAEGRATLTLLDGTEAPVSRSYVKPLREAGWF
ncbi:MAG: LytTR family transcriptional regulator DNA-binding domain-containing protein [Caulobacteraceae bacterium]|nr:LytTR family transcriptional regulator DNA-binding domain-containing protein [Caulobacteraceae bacterium]